MVPYSVVDPGDPILWIGKVDKGPEEPTQTEYDPAICERNVIGFGNGSDNRDLYVLTPGICDYEPLAEKDFLSFATVARVNEIHTLDVIRDQFDRSDRAFLGLRWDVVETSQTTGLPIYDSPDCGCFGIE